MARQIWITRDEAELLVDVLEDNYKTGKFEQAGVGADFASEVRRLFGMVEQPDLKPSRSGGMEGYAQFWDRINSEHDCKAYEFIAREAWNAAIEACKEEIDEEHHCFLDDLHA